MELVKPRQGNLPKPKGTITGHKGPIGGLLLGLVRVPRTLLLGPFEMFLVMNDVTKMQTSALANFGELLARYPSGSIKEPSQA